MTDSLVRIPHPFDRGEITIVESILSAEGIHYIVQDESLGPELSGRARQSVFVFQADAERASELLSPLMGE